VRRVIESTRCAAKANFPTSRRADEPTIGAIRRNPATVKER
jgi:hypothetical protein